MITIARCDSESALFAAAAFVDKHHSYIRWADRPSRKLYWTIHEDGERIGVFGLGSAFSRPKAVADFMASNALEFNHVANNIVFALAGQRDRNAGTQAMALIRHDAIRLWHDRYGDALGAFQTFIAPPRTGAMYRADNWAHIGMTTGDGMETQTLCIGEDAPEGARIRVTTFGGKTTRIIQTRTKVVPKMIFVRLVSRRETRRAMAPPAIQRDMFATR